jgi:hypothetical protein
MRGSAFLRRIPNDNPVVRTWLDALRDARSRTRAALTGINPWDPIVPLMREKYNLLIGEPTAEYVQLQLGTGDPEQERMTTVIGRNLITGLPRLPRTRRIGSMQVFCSNLPLMKSRDCFSAIRSS